MNREYLFEVCTEATCDDEHPRLLVCGIETPDGTRLCLRLLPEAARELVTELTRTLADCEDEA